MRYSGDFLTRCFKDFYTRSRQPPTAEEQQYRQRLVTLPKRGVVVYDREKPNPKIHWTPTVELPEVAEAQIDSLETEQLELTGITTEEARDEINNRRAYWKGVLSQSPAAKFNMGGSV